MEDEKKSKGNEAPTVEQALDARSAAAFPMTRWKWEDRRAYKKALDPVLAAHIFGRDPE